MPILIEQEVFDQIPEMFPNQPYLKHSFDSIRSNPIQSDRSNLLVLTYNTYKNKYSRSLIIQTINIRSTECCPVHANKDIVLTLNSWLHKTLSTGEKKKQLAVTIVYI
ncbi:hypothetical protein LOAG_04802 [Loa loa]|uniref:Uncharacterized protein n=1 Tax=Loa loa TaxID=7209 RepID=A0A1S0U1D1_LOALO|nr:hypothetical protein LOAG_04802 [Loa loa]EFO23682.1 hypothetical protein LOAG_04802 [Loa loa]